MSVCCVERELGQLRELGGLCEVEGEVVKSGEQVGVKPDRWMVGLRCSGGGMEKEGKG